MALCVSLLACPLIIQASFGQTNEFDSPYRPASRFQLPIPISVSDDGVLPDFDVTIEADSAPQYRGGRSGSGENEYSQAPIPRNSDQVEGHLADAGSEYRPSLRGSRARGNESQRDQSSATLRLPPRSELPSEPHQSDKKSAYGDPVRMFSSLALVLGTFFVFMWFVRRYRVPREGEESLFDTVGKVPLLGKKAHIVKFGDRLLLLAKSGNGLEKLAEVTQPQEVERVLKLCRGPSTDQLGSGLNEILKRQASNSRDTIQNTVPVSSLVHN